VEEWAHDGCHSETKTYGGRAEERGGRKKERGSKQTVLAWGKMFKKKKLEGGVFIERKDI